MSYKQVKYFQDLEDYPAAYQIAREDWEANPSLKWPKNTIAWLLIRMMKFNARAYSKNKFLQQLEEFKALRIPADDKKLWGAVAWPIRDIVEDSYNRQWFSPQFGDKLFVSIRDLPFDRPSDSYSAIVNAFIQLGGLWPRLSEFIEWWGFENFTDFDYRRYPINGMMSSLAERVYRAYIAGLYWENRQREPSKVFYDGLKELAAHSQEQADNIYNSINHGKH